MRHVWFFSTVTAGVRNQRVTNEGRHVYGGYMEHPRHGRPRTLTQRNCVMLFIPSLGISNAHVNRSRLSLLVLVYSQGQMSTSSQRCGKGRDRSQVAAELAGAALCRAGSWPRHPAKTRFANSAQRKFPMTNSRQVRAVASQSRQTDPGRSSPWARVNIQPRDSGRNTKHGLPHHGCSKTPDGTGIRVEPGATLNFKS